jgi:hypothetical protein
VKNKEKKKRKSVRYNIPITVIILITDIMYPGFTYHGSLHIGT